MAEILVRDDIVPYLESLGIAARLDYLSTEMLPMSDLICHVKVWGWEHGVPLAGLDGYQIEHMIADLALAGKLNSATLIEGSNVEGVSRSAAPTGMGVSAENVWANAPGESYLFRFYVNGELKTTLTNYYITTLASIGAVPGDTVSISQLADNVVGWWASIEVP